MKKEIIMWKMMIERDTNNNNGTSQINLSIRSVCAQLFYLLLPMESYYVVLTICILAYKYDTNPRSFVYIPLFDIILDLHNRWGVSNSTKGLDLSNAINRYESNWNRILMIESYPNHSKQQQANKPGEISQILHVM